MRQVVAYKNVKNNGKLLYHRSKSGRACTRDVPATRLCWESFCVVLDKKSLMRGCRTWRFGCFNDAVLI